MKKEPRREHHHLVRFVHNIGINKKYTTIALYALAVLCFALICIYFLLHPENYTSVFETLTGIVSPIFIGLIIAYLLNPFLEFFENVVFITKAQRTLRRARRGLLNSKLAYDQVRLKPTSTEKDIQAALERLDAAKRHFPMHGMAFLQKRSAKTMRLPRKQPRKRRVPLFTKSPRKIAPILCGHLL